jgi:Zn-dependent peptidase ImmA (M78 family)/DNA-binding XRE family transcriptional regulator
MLTRVPVEPKILVWARNRNKLSLEGAAKRLNCEIETLRKIESGDVIPAATLFRKMAIVYLVPEATLLGLDAPPPERELPKDFRSFDGTPVELSYETMVAIRQVEARQDALAELAEIDTDIIAPVLPHRSLQDNAEKFGEEFRKEIGFPILVQMRAKPEAAFLRWRILIEKIGVSVYVEPFGKDTSRGVSLFYNAFPAIIIDQNEKLPGARSFTLFHEYAHLLLRQAGVSNFDPRNRVEAFCNRFASAVLMPREAMEAVFKNILMDGAQPTMEELSDGANQLCVTIHQIAARLESLQFVRSGYYNRVTSVLKKPDKKKRGGGGSDTFKYAYLSRFGHYLPEAVFGAHERGHLSKIGASRLLKIKPAYFAPLRKIISGRNAGEQIDER